jgi:hypothetical protein
VKQPRLNVRDALNAPAARTLFGLLLKQESPIRLRAAREELKLSIAQFGLAMRSLERHGLAQRRHIATSVEDMVPKLQHSYLEATDLGREHGMSFANAEIPAAGPQGPPARPGIGPSLL